MKTHTLKIWKEFADAKLKGDKLFELRRNDRGFQVGDEVRYLTVGKTGNKIVHELDARRYIITYVLNGFDGLKNSHCVFGEREIKQ